MLFATTETRRRNEVIRPACLYPKCSNLRAREYSTISLSLFSQSSVRRQAPFLRCQTLIHVQESYIANICASSLTSLAHTTNPTSSKSYLHNHPSQPLLPLPPPPPQLLPPQLHLQVPPLPPPQPIILPIKIKRPPPILLPHRQKPLPPLKQQPPIHLRARPRPHDMPGRFNLVAVFHLAGVFVDVDPV